MSVLVIDTEARPSRAGADRRHAVHRRRGPAGPGRARAASRPQQMAGLLYDSLHGKLLTLPDAVEVYPAHGAGSLCGKNISKETSSTIGEQRRSNHALQPMSREAFVANDDRRPARSRRATSRMDVEINRRGAPPLADARPAARARRPGKLRRGRRRARSVLDVRSSATSAPATCRARSTSAWAASSRRGRARCSIPRGRSLIVADDDERVGEAVMRLARVGLENVAGYAGRRRGRLARVGPAAGHHPADHGRRAARAWSGRRRAAGDRRAPAGRSTRPATFPARSRRRSIGWPTRRGASIPRGRRR